MSYAKEKTFIIVTMSVRTTKSGKEIYEYSTDQGNLTIWKNENYPQNGLYAPGTKLLITSTYEKEYNQKVSWNLAKKSNIEVKEVGLPIPTPPPVQTTANTDNVEPQVKNSPIQPPTQSANTSTQDTRPKYELMSLQQLFHEYDLLTKENADVRLLGHIENIIGRKRLIESFTKGMNQVAEQMNLLSKTLNNLELRLSQVEKSQKQPQTKEDYFDPVRSQ